MAILGSDRAPDGQGWYIYQSQISTKKVLAIKMVNAVIFGMEYLILMIGSRKSPKGVSKLKFQKDD